MTDPARGHLDLNLPLLVQESVSREFDGKCRRLPVSTRARFDGRPPAVCFAKSTFFRAGSASPMAAGSLFCKKYLFFAWARLGGRRFFSQGPASPMAAGSLFCKKYFFSQGPACQMAAGGLFCNSSLLVEVLWLIRMQSYICTMIIADSAGGGSRWILMANVETQKPRGAFAVEPAGRFRRSAGCAPCSGLSTGSRRSLSPKARVTFSSVARVGLPSSDSAS